MENKFQPLENGNIAVSLPKQMIKLQELKEYIHKSFEQEGLNAIKHRFHEEGRGHFPASDPDFGREAWLSNGVVSEILTPSSDSWQKGRIRVKISFEFKSESQNGEPLESESSSLDNLR